MPPSTDVIRADFDRIATASRSLPDGIEPAARSLLVQVPLRSRVLEVGCGAGALARDLATKRGARVTAIDLSPRMIDVARVRTSDSLGIEYRVADFLALAPRGFDVVISNATLHHLPLAIAAERMAQAVNPGGLVMIADLFEARGVWELPYNAVSWLRRRLKGATKPATTELAAAWQAHGENDELLSLSQIRATLRAALPGVTVRRHLAWRYTAIWRKP